MTTTGRLPHMVIRWEVVREGLTIGTYRTMAEVIACARANPGAAIAQIETTIGH